jgi:hypothetical protein
MNKDDFSRGFICACAVTMRNHECDSIIEDTLKCNYMSVAQMKKIGVDEYDIEILMPIINEIERKKKL